MAVSEGVHGNEQRDAIRESSRLVARHDRFGSFTRGVASLVQGLVHEAGRLLRVAAVAGVIGAAVGFALVMLGYNDPVVGLKHFASAPHCAIAEELGLPHAKYGQPGYWRHHDRDGDAIACNS